MRKFSGNFQALWDDPSGNVALADLWTFALITGQVLRWTSSDMPIMDGGNTFLTGPIIKRGGTRLTSTLEVDSLDVTIETGDSITLSNIPFPHAAANGALDGATVKLERAFMRTWGQVTASVHLFEGRVASVDPSHTEVKITVKSALEILDSKWPRNLYQPACCHSLYGSGCGLKRAEWQEDGIAQGGHAARVSWPTGHRGKGYFDQGVILFTGGLNSGARRTIKGSDANGLDIALPLPHPVASGDPFQIVPGCDKGHLACQNKFQNLLRYRGFPWVPPPETAR